MSLPPTAVSPPNTTVQAQPGMIILPVCQITGGTASALVAGQGSRSNVSVSVQPGMQVKAVCLVNSSGQFVTF